MDLSQKILKQLIQIKSYSGQEKKLADFIMDFCKKNNLPAENQDGNIIIKYLTNSQKCLIFNAHMDTINEGDINLWHYPPFGKESAIIKDEKMYGLGASDDKASIVSLLLTALAFKDKKPPLDLFFVFVTKEETDGSGTHSFIYYFKKKYLKSYQEIAAVLTEPTNNNFVEIGHRGNYFIKIITSGQSGHGANPSIIKKQAIEEMFVLYSKMKLLGKKLQKKFFDKDLGLPTFSLTGIKSVNGPPNKIPSSCYSIWDIRTTPKLHEQLLTILKENLGNKIKIELVAKPGSYALTNPKEKIVQVFKKIIPDIKIKISIGSSDIWLFSDCEIHAISFGPGNKEKIHKENEYVEVKNIDKAKSIYLKLINVY